MCSLCGNIFDLDKSAESIEILPCMDDSCKSCASTSRMLSSPMCSACYGDFACPRVVRAQVQASLPKLQMTHLSSTSDTQKNFLSGTQDRYAELNRADVDSDDDDSVSDLGSPMKVDDDNDDDDEGNRAVSELSDEDLRDALLQANNRVGTNFSIQEIGFETPLDHLGLENKAQLADILTELCTLTVSESDVDESCDKGSQEPEANDSSPTMHQQAQETVHIDLPSCSICHRQFYSTGHLRQHMSKHDARPRTCKVCGGIFATAASCRLHEKKHRETDSERAQRLKDAKAGRDRVRPVGNRRGRVSQVLGQLGGRHAPIAID